MRMTIVIVAVATVLAGCTALFGDAVHAVIAAAQKIAVPLTEPISHHGRFPSAAPKGPPVPSDVSEPGWRAWAEFVVVGESSLVRAGQAARCACWAARSIWAWTVPDLVDTWS